MVNYFNGGGGIKNKRAEQVIGIDYVEFLIKNNPYKEQIEKVRAIRSQEDYDVTLYEEEKCKLPYITPNATFYNERLKANAKKVSGYIYFDLDQKDFKMDVDAYKVIVLSKYADKICMLGKSVGGVGLFFYVKVKTGLSVDNFDAVWSYFRNDVFTDLIIDTKAKDISRAQFLTSDADLYVNHSVDADIPVYLFSKSVSDNYDKPVTNKKSKNKKEVKNIQSVYKDKGRECYIPTECFIDYKILCNTLILQTPVSFPNDEKVIIKEIDFVKVPILRIIKSGSRHNMFKIIINALMYLNSDITLHQLQSWINFWNVHMTDVALERKDMMITVQREFERLKAGGKNIVKIKKKTVHTNPKYDNRRATANDAIASNKKAKSCKKISDAIEALKLEDKPVNQKNVFEKLAEEKENKLSLSTIERYWRQLVPKVKAEKIKMIKSSAKELATNTEQINNTQNKIPMEQKDAIVVNMYKVQRTPEQEAAFQKTIAYNEYRKEHCDELFNIFENTKKEFDARFEKYYEEQLKAKSKKKSKTI